MEKNIAEWILKEDSNWQKLQDMCVFYLLMGEKEWLAKSRAKTTKIIFQDIKLSSHF